jgi:hypothetical protein
MRAEKYEEKNGDMSKSILSEYTIQALFTCGTGQMCDECDEVNE